MVFDCESGSSAAASTAAIGWPTASGRSLLYSGSEAILATCRVFEAPSWSRSPSNQSAIFRGGPAKYSY